MFRLDHSQCSDKILTAIAENKIQFDAMDATEGLMTFESSYANFKEGLGDFNPDCNQFRRGLYLQVILIHVEVKLNSKKMGKWICDSENI